MKRLIFISLTLILFASVGFSQALSTTTEVRSKGVTSKADAEMAMFNSNKEVFKPQTLNRIITIHLKSDGLLSDSDTKLNFQLSENSLKVNNKVMTANVHNKYLTLYLGFTRQPACDGCPVKYDFNDSLSALLAEGY